MRMENAIRWKSSFTRLTGALPCIRLTHIEEVKMTTNRRRRCLDLVLFDN